MAQQRNMIINFMDGTKIAYDYPQQSVDDMQMIKRIETILEKQFLSIEGDGAVHLYPVCNIKSIQVHPVPDKLPESVIRGAQAVDLY